MKIRKTRIKTETLANGKVEYSPQYKYFIWWCDFNEFYACSDVFRIFGEWAKMRRNKKFAENTDEWCKDLIDYYVRQVKYQQACKIENAVVKAEYEKYP